MTDLAVSIAVDRTGVAYDVFIGIRGSYILLVGIWCD